MKRILTIALTLLATASAAPLVAGEPCGCCSSCATCGCDSCGCDSCGCNRYSYHIERVETRYRVDVEDHKWYVVTAKTTETTVPTTRCVPVKVIDPCTGCERTEMKEVPSCDKVKTTCADIAPVDECKPKVEERVKVCTTVYLDCKPVVEIKKAAPPAPPAPEPIPAPMPNK